MEEITQLKDEIKYLKEQVKEMKQSTGDIDVIKNDVGWIKEYMKKNGFARKEELEPLKKIVYGLVLAVLGAFVAIIAK